MKLQVVMGEGFYQQSDQHHGVTFSTRSLLRWGDLTVPLQPLPIRAYSLSPTPRPGLAYRASRETRAMLHELAQRMFPQQMETQGPNAISTNSSL